jgi:hypothetical protein
MSVSGHQGLIEVNSTASLISAIQGIDSQPGGTFEIDLISNITLTTQLPAIVLSQSTFENLALTINGEGHTLSGNDTFRGLFVYSGNVTIENLQISHAVARGGDGRNGGGGGAGLGGGLLIADDVAHGAASPGNVTLINVGFDHDQAIGGNADASTAGAGGGGGMGGSATDDGPDDPGTQGGVGIGPNGYGEGGTNYQLAAIKADPVTGNNAGFGGGGYGGYFNAAENGSFGGGGGSDGSAPGKGGFGAGNGVTYGAGAGLGAGGDIFVQQGAGLTIIDGTLANGTANGGGAFDSLINDGWGYGSGIFMQGNGQITIESLAGQVTNINGQISDESGSSGQNAGQSAVIIEGAGTVALNVTNPFSASTVLENQATSGTVDLNAVGAAGGAVQFRDPATLRIENAAFTNRHFTTTIIGFGYADVIDIPGLAFVAGASAQYNATSHVLVVTSAGISATFDDVFSPLLPSFSALNDGKGGTEVVEALNGGAPRATSADMVMRNGSTGQFEIYDVGQNAILGAATLGYVESKSQQAQWQLAGLGSFNGADTADMMLRNTTTGALELYDVNNNNFTAGFSVGQVGPEWSVSGFGAFSSRPGETDMLMRNGIGQFEIYDISNNAITSAAPMGQVGPEWSVAGFGDFSTRPNETDMLMRNSNTGQFEIYDISNNQLTSAAPMGQVGLEWSVAGFGDFSGRANETDMLMRNNNTGQLELYDIGNSKLTSAAPMGQVGLEWSVVGFGDFSGNANESDMLMRNTHTGQFEVYDITNNQLTSAAGMGQVGLEWQNAGIASNPTGGFAAADAQLAQAMASFAPSGGALEMGSPDTQTIAQAAASALASETAGITAGGKPAPVTSL